MNNDDFTVPEEQAIMDSLRRIVQALRRASTRYQGSTSAQIFVLRTLEAHDGASVSDLAHLTHTHQSTVSEMITRLETNGLIERRIAQDDRRRVELYLSAAGRSLIREQVKTPQEDIVEAIAAMSNEDRGALSQGLKALTRTAGLDKAPPQLFFEGNDE
jgi:DNA-binding MarR family transcriptional regulator